MIRSLAWRISFQLLSRQGLLTPQIELVRLTVPLDCTTHGHPTNSLLNLVLTRHPCCSAGPCWHIPTTITTLHSLCHPHHCTTHWIAPTSPWEPHTIPCCTSPTPETDTPHGSQRREWELRDSSCYCSQSDRGTHGWVGALGLQLNPWWATCDSWPSAVSPSSMIRNPDTATEDKKKVGRK